ncbi:MAG: NAD-dependent epimerase/dehydratase family protein [Caldimonas sp.]
MTGAAAAPGSFALRRVAVTGASGFVGRALCRRLLAEGVAVRALVRGASTGLTTGCEAHVIGDLEAASHDWPAALRDVDAVFHLAAIANAATGPVRAVNVHATRGLARAAFAGGCRLVHVSSIKVHGDAGRVVVNEQAPLLPDDDYGRSKLEGERAIEAAGAEAAGQWVALRPPIVYGPGDRGNFARLIRLACSGLPLPLARVPNRRSMIHVDALADALVRAATLEIAPNRALVVAGGPPLSTPEWLRLIAGAAGRPLRLWSLPPAWLQAGASLLGVGGAAQRLLGSLEVDDARWRRLAGWQPPISQEDAVAATVRAARMAP